MKIHRFLRSMLFPERCPYCGKMIEPNEIICPSCHDEVQRKHVPIKGGARGFRCVSSFVYDGKVRRMILRIKYRDRTQYIRQIADIIAGDIAYAYGENAFDVITAVPIHKKDRYQRGYNQSKILAKALSTVMDLPYCDTLLKIRHTKKQHNLTYAERKTNLNGAFQLIDQELVRDKRILIIDDIVTSGYTLGNCCKVLSKGKPQLICCATIANAQRKYPEATVI